MSAPKPREYEVETPVELSTPAQIALKLSLMKPLGKYNYSLVTRIDGEMLEPPRTIVYPESVLEEVNPVVLADLSRRHQERLEEGGLEPSTPSRFRNESIGRTITVTTKKRGFLGNALNKLKQIAGVEDSQARTTTTTGTVEPREYVEEVRGRWKELTPEMRSRVKERLQGDGNNTTQEIDEAINQVQDEEARKVEQDNTVRKWQEVDTVYRRLNSDQQAQVTAYHTATPEATPEDIHSYMGDFLEEQVEVRTNAQWRAVDATFNNLSTEQQKKVDTYLDGHPEATSREVYELIKSLRGDENLQVEAEQPAETAGQETNEVRTNAQWRAVDATFNNLSTGQQKKVNTYLDGHPEATPREVYELIKSLRGDENLQIEAEQPAETAGQETNIDDRLIADIRFKHGQLTSEQRKEASTIAIVRVKELGETSIQAMNNALNEVIKLVHERRSTQADNETVIAVNEVKENDEEDRTALRTEIRDRWVNLDEVQRARAQVLYISLMQFGATSEEHVMSKVIDQISTEEGSKPVPVEVLSVESFPDSDEPQAEEDKDTVQVKVLERQRLTEAATTLNQKQRADMSVYVVANPRATAQELMTEMYLVKKHDELYTQLGRYGQEYMNAYRAANSQASTEELLGEMQKIITARDSETPEEEAIALPVQSSTPLPPVNGSNGNGKASTGDKLSTLPQKPATLSENGSSNGTVNGSSGNGVNSPATKLRDIIGASKK